MFAIKVPDKKISDNVFGIFKDCFSFLLANKNKLVH